MAGERETAAGRQAPVMGNHIIIDILHLLASRIIISTLHPSQRSCSNS